MSLMELGVKNKNSMASSQMFFDKPFESIDSEETKESQGVIKFKVTCVENFALMLKKLSFVSQMLSDQKNDYGLEALMQAFRNCMFCEILDQFYNGEMTYTFKEQHKKILDRVQEFVVRRLHSYLFRLQSGQDEEFTEKADKLQWVTPG